ncbi:MAG: hypothetical protein LUM44_24295 [Pyrinomonadaceae bacterium]|nr:hypothetical protein [Pyrinomonadaceae bacterium]
METSNNLLDFEIDKLTNSIENSLTGEIFDTEITKITRQDKRLIKKSDWVFDWHLELKVSFKEVFKLTTLNNFDIIQGLIALEDKKDHIFIHLLESAKFNKGKDKLYLGVAGNLVAFACKISFEKNYEGFVAFDSKTALIKHYERSLGAKYFRGQRMFIETRAAEQLVVKYFAS